MHHRYSVVLSLVLAVIATSLAPPAHAAPYATPTVTTIEVGTNLVELEVTAGSTGLPQGFSIYWMTQTDYDDYGSVWPELITYPGLHWANFNGTPTLNDGDGAYTTFNLAPFQSIRIQIGDLEDETGVTTNTPEELEIDTDYIACSFANAGGGWSRSGYSENTPGVTILKQRDCIHSQGYWKNHPSAWPVSSLTLGTVTYSQAQLLQILNNPANGNGLISMAKQLIGVLLNVANGADPAPIATQISQAQALIGNKVVPPIGNGYLAPNTTSSLTDKFDKFNNNMIDTECHDITKVQTSSWGRLKALYR